MSLGDLFKGLMGRRSLDIKQEGLRVKLSVTAFDVDLGFRPLPRMEEGDLLMEKDKGGKES